jgi:hypothetical protein
MLAYAPGSVSGLADLTWFDHRGKQLGNTGESGLYIELAISPDESKVVKRSNIDLWVFELARGIHTRLTTAGANRYPLWTPDGKSVIYGSSNQSSALTLYRKAVDGESAPELLASAKAGLIPTDVSHDGQFVAITTSSPENKQDVVIMPLSGEHKLTPFMQTPFNERAARFSPMVSGWPLAPMNPVAMRSIWRHSRMAGANGKSPMPGAAHPCGAATAKSSISSRATTRSWPQPSPW